jgi:XTP/dITP diphosphohydrolase
MIAGPDSPGSRFFELVDVMDQLRTRCPWTKEQTHATLSHYLLEETYETLEALDTGDSAHLREELGDVLMQVVFHARIAAETEGWDIDSVAGGIAEKLRYRNPHVFDDAGVALAEGITAEQIDANWQALKAAEKHRSSALEGVPAHLPALAYADKVLGRIGDVDVPGDDIGSRLLALVKEARAEGVNAEEALRITVNLLITG